MNQALKRKQIMESSAEELGLNEELMKAIEERDEQTKNISNTLERFINNRDEGVKAGLAPEFSKVDYLYSRINDLRALVLLTDGYNHSNMATIDFNQANLPLPDSSHKKIQYQQAATGYKSASEAFSESAELAEIFLKTIDKTNSMHDLFKLLYSSVNTVRDSAKKLLDKSAEAQKLAENY